jgi:hypothetical protein
LAYDIAYWSKEFGVTGDELHEAIRSHGTQVEKVPAAYIMAPEFLQNRLVDRVFAAPKRRRLLAPLLIFISPNKS